MYKLLVLLLIGIKCANSKRVCKTFPDYYNVFSKDCYDSPYLKMSQAEIIRSWGFTAEEYDVVTEDGYILNLVRGYANKTKKHAVVVGHGFASNGYQIIFKGTTSLAYVLGKSGYEFWIPNYRGSKFSRGHTYLSDKNESYWDFSFHEMAIYDLPATLNKVTEITKTEKSIYIGISMGTTISYIFATKKPDIAEKKLTRIVSLAPIAYLGDIKSFLKFAAPFDWLLKRIPYLINNHGEFVPLLKLGFQNYVCSYTPLQMLSCEIALDFASGFNFKNIDPSVGPLIPGLNFDSTSVRVPLHFSQMMKSGRFAEYDYGKKKNLRIYVTEKPPVYDFKSVTVPVTLFAGAKDWLGVKKAAGRIYGELNPGVQCGLTVVPGYTHFDFIRAKNVEKYFFPSLISSIDNECTK